VVWQGTLEGLNTYGLLFTKIKDEDKERLYQFIHEDFREQINKQWWDGVVIKEGGEEMEDRRIFERFNAHFPLRFLSLGENKEGQAVTQDISAKGMSFVTNEDLIPRTPLEMWLQVPDKGEPIYTRGEVVWSKMVEPTKYRAGVELEEAEFMSLSRVLRAMKAK
jgi:c-di-GMP-binding flagellar brake protein YcgR